MSKGTHEKDGSRWAWLWILPIAFFILWKFGPFLLLPFGFGEPVHFDFQPSYHRTPRVIKSWFRVPLQKVFPPEVHPWGHFASTSPIIANEVINGIEVPPMPNEAEDKATLAGVDANNNGERDEVERYVAEKFGDNQKYFMVMTRFSRDLQYEITHFDSMSREEAKTILHDNCEIQVNPELSLLNTMKERQNVALLILDNNERSSVESGVYQKYKLPSYCDPSDF